MEQIVLLSIIAGVIVIMVIVIARTEGRVARLVGLLEDAKIEATRAIAERDQVQAELDQIKQRRHTTPTLAMIEDMQAVLNDAQFEVDVIQQRLKKAKAILSNGRTGPYAYTAPDSADKPRQQPVKLWQ